MPGHVDGIIRGDLFGIEFLRCADDTGADGPEETLGFQDGAIFFQHSEKGVREDGMSAAACIQHRFHSP